MSVDLNRIRAAHERIRAYITRTPVLTSSRLDEASGALLFFKCENFQKIGAFKARGATNAVFSLDDAIARRGVATHSSGNHGAAVARAAKLRGIPSQVVMPSNSAKVKVRAIESYGAQIVFCEPTEEARESACADVIEKTGAIMIHSFENEDVMAGQGTAAVELLEDIPDLDLVMCPIGGGGLLSGTAVAAKSLRTKNKSDRRRTSERRRRSAIISGGQTDCDGKEIHDRRRTANKCRPAKLHDYPALRGRYRDRERRSDCLSHAHHLGDDEDHRRAVRSRSVCRDRSRQDRHHWQTCRHHSHRWQCRSRRAAVDIA